jgi:LuxR family maltose regulon positive regulatory protein
MGNMMALPVSLPEICAPREELLNYIDNAAKKQIVYISSPGGYGKTVSMLLWLKKHSCRAAWHSFDEYDDTLALFYLLFCRALLSVLPQDKEVANIVNASAFRNAPVEMTIEMLTKADFGHEAVAIVLDDFHTVGNETVLKSLPFVLKRLPDTVSVFILSRNDIPEGFAALENAGKVSVVGTHSLAFSADEIQKHLANYGRFATAREAQQLRNYSEGWIILLNAMIVSGNLQAGAKNTRVSYKAFFEKNIWNSLDADRRTFLMKSAMPDEFTVKLCEALTGKENCEDYIDMLIRGNANISVAGEVYRYHDLFREFLLEQLDKSSIEQPELCRMAAQYYLDENNYFKARRYSVRSGGIAVIEESFKRIAEDKYMSLDEYIEMSKIFHEAELPEDVCEKLPFMYASKVAFYYLSGNAGRFEFFIDKLKASMPTIVSKFPQTLETAMSCFMMDYRIPYAQIAAMIAKAPVLPKRIGGQQIGTATFHLPFIHRSGRDFYELVNPEAFDLVVREVNDKLLRENSECLSLAIRAGLWMEQNNLSDASGIFSQARSALKDTTNHEVGFGILLGQANTALLQGNRDAHAAYLREAKLYIETNRAHYLLRNLWAYEARCQLLDGSKQAAQAWLENYFIGTGRFGELYKLYQNFTTVRAYIVLGDYHSALNALSAISETSVSMRRPLDAAEANVLKSVVYWALGEKKKSAAILTDVLSALRPYGFIRVIADEGKSVMPILSAVKRQTGKSADSNAAMLRFAQEVYVCAYEQSKRFKGLTGSLLRPAVKLSKQQTLVLDFLSKGYTNAQIVNLAGISLNTVRYHTKIVYQKLEVTNMMDAVVRAKELKLLR